MVPAIRPPLRWAGSKRRLIPLLLLAAPTAFKRYFEPFAGSASLFFSLEPRAAILNDINMELLNFYRVLRSRPREVAVRVASMPPTSCYYYELRAKVLGRMTAVDRAARFLYLNRYCFNGVYRTNRKGVFNVPRGINTGSLPSATELSRCSRLLRRAKLCQGDFEDVMSEVRSTDFVYLDPPYASVERKAYGEYGYGSYSTNDHGRLVSSIRAADSRGAKIILSYRDCAEIVEALPGWCHRTITVRRHIAGFAASRRSLTEMLLSNFELPAGAQTRQ